MRPIIYGILAFIASGIVWIITSFGAFAESLTGTGGTSVIWMYISGAIFFTSLPLAIIAEIVRWWRSRKPK